MQTVTISLNTNPIIKLCRIFQLNTEIRNNKSMSMPSCLPNFLDWVSCLSISTAKRKPWICGFGCYIQLLIFHCILGK